MVIRNLLDKYCSQKWVPVPFIDPPLSADSIAVGHGTSFRPLVASFACTDVVRERPFQTGSPMRERPKHASRFFWSSRSAPSSRAAYWLTIHTAMCRARRIVGNCFAACCIVGGTGPLRRQRGVGGRSFATCAFSRNRVLESRPPMGPVAPRAAAMPAPKDADIQPFIQPLRERLDELLHPGRLAAPCKRKTSKSSFASPTPSAARRKP